MKTLLGILICAIAMSSCMSMERAHHNSTANVRHWKPVKDKTPYQKSMKYAERD
jgi:hypothetical protein